MKECEEKILISLKKYNGLKKVNNNLAKENKRLNKLIKEEKGCFEISEYKSGAYYFNQDEHVDYFKNAYSIKFHNKLKNTIVDKTIKGLESLLDEYENKMLDLFKIIVHRGKEKDVHIYLGEDFYNAQMQKLEEVHNAIREKIIKEESELIESEKIKKLQSKINKIPFWIKVIFNIE